MRESEPFQPDDLEELHTELFSHADRVVPMFDVARGDIGARTIGLRHDVDDNEGSLETAVRLAEWEFEHGYSSTYFLLHGSHYWGEEMLVVAEQLEELGHEVGIHVNAVAEALRTGRTPQTILACALEELRMAARVVGCVAHGDPLCHSAWFVNDEMFSESRRSNCGAADRVLKHEGKSVRLQPIPRGEFSLQYDSNWLSRGDYLSDSGGKWSQSFGETAGAFPGRGQLHLLVHPDWWAEAFAGVVV